MKNLRYLITVLALVNASLVAQAAAASKPGHHHGFSALGSTVSSPASVMLAGGLHTGNE